MTLEELMSYDLYKIMKDTIADAEVSHGGTTDQNVMTLFKLNMVRARDATYKFWMEQAKFIGA
jgi:hypothetical protein